MTLMLVLPSHTLILFFFFSSVEHPAAGYKKIFETVEELSEPIPAKIIGRTEQKWIYI